MTRSRAQLAPTKETLEESTASRAQLAPTKETLEESTASRAQLAPTKIASDKKFAEIPFFLGRFLSKYPKQKHSLLQKKTYPYI